MKRGVSKPVEIEEGLKVCVCVCLWSERSLNKLLHFLSSPVCVLNMLYVVLYVIYLTCVRMY